MYQVKLGEQDTFIAACEGNPRQSWILDSRRGIGIPGTEFRILCQWNLILNSKRSWDSRFLELYPRFADSTSKRNVEVPQVKESGFHGMRRVLIHSSSKFERY